MAQKKVVILDTVAEKLDVPQGTDTYLMAEDVAITGALSVTSAITSTLATGTAPLVIASTTAVTNLNADLLDGNEATAFAAASHTHAYLANVVEDTTPQLGGSLDVNAQKIVSTANGDIDIEPNGTGNVLLGNFVFNADATIGAGQDNYVITYDHATGLFNPEAAPTPAGVFMADGSVDMTGEFRTDVGTFDSDVANGASAVAFSYDTAVAYSAAGSKLASWKNNTAEKIHFTKDGYIVFGINATPPSIRDNGTDLLLYAVNAAQAAINGTGLYLYSGKGISFAGASFFYGGSNKVEHRNAANAQTLEIYGDYASTTDYQRSGFKTSRTATTVPSAASFTLSGLVPAGALLIGVTSRVDTLCTTATGYTVGDGIDADLWGVAATVTVGTATGSANFTAAGAAGFLTTARDVVVTATGGNFDGTGVITVCAHYLITEAD